MGITFPTFRRLWNSRYDSGSIWPRRATPDQRKALLRLIAIAAEERIPAIPLILNWSADERGVQKRRLRRLAGLLQANVALPDAIEQVPGVLADEDILTIRCASQTGTLNATIRQSLAEPDLLSSRARSEVRKTLMELGILLVVGICVIAFIQIKLVPALLKILEEFDGRPTTPQLFTHAMTEFCMKFGWLAVVLILIGLWVVFSTRAGRFVRQALLDRYFVTLREWHAAEVVQSLAGAAEAGRPLPGALSTLARYHFDHTIRHKLLFVRNEVEQGADLWQSLATVRMLSDPEILVMETATRVGNRGWALKQLAQTKKVRVTRRLESISGLLTPMLVFVAGAIVLLQASAMFGMLIRIIESVE